MSLTWTTEFGAGVYGNPELSKKARFIAAKQMKLREAVDPAKEFNLGKKSGDKVQIRLVGRISTTAHTALNELQPVPLGQPPISEVQGQVYRRAYGISWTGTAADLDRMDVNDMNVRVLREHAARTYNKVIYDVLVAGRSFTYVPLTASTANFDDDGSPTGTNAYALTSFHLRGIAKNMEKCNVPFFDGENYLLMVSTTHKFDILGDTATNGFIDVKKYANGGPEAILNNEIGSVAGFRIISDNDVLSNALNTSYGESIAVGYEACKEIMVYPIHFRYNGNVGGDFANQAALAWQCMSGYKVPWNYTTHGQGSVLHVTTA
jgi:N4-gp56 family major capsid protein